MSPWAAAAMTAYHGVPPTTISTRATTWTEPNHWNWSARAYWNWAPMSTPTTAAMAAEMQKTTVRMTLTLRPWTSRTVGESPRARSIRPMRLLSMATTRTVAATANTTTR